MTFQRHAFITTHFYNLVNEIRTSYADRPIDLLRV